jgi:HD-GYP domain-containing protein (c-di-GMP phosphodiesterase class II)
MWLHGVDGGDKVFYTTGRLTSEMVLKSAQMGVPIIVSRSGVTQMGHELGTRLGLDEDACDKLIIAGQLHDIGLLAVPESVVRNQQFGPREHRAVQKHSEVSYEVLRPLEMLADVLPAIRSHHERLNGTGYPQGLAGENIPLFARILAVADAYDAMTHDRPHRPALRAVLAMRELRRCCPSGYDPACVDALAAAINAPALEETAAAQIAGSRS